TRLLVGRNRALGGDNPESDVIAPIPIAQHCSPRPQTPVSERRQRRVVKVLASFEVPDPDREMSDHSRSLLVKLTATETPTPFASLCGYILATKSLERLLIPSGIFRACHAEGRGFAPPPPRHDHLSENLVRAHQP